MQRWRGKTGPRDRPLGLPTLMTGSIRNPNEDEALTVTLSMHATGFALHADDVALGSWSADEVEIVPLGDRAFEFVAEGDRLIFVPDDLDAFLTRLNPDATRRKRRKRASSSGAGAKPASSPGDGERPSASGTETTPERDQPRKVPPSRPRPKTRPKPKAKPTTSATAGRQTATAPAATAAAAPRSAGNRKAQIKAIKLRRKPKPDKQQRAQTQKPAAAVPTTAVADEDREGRWIRTIDSARRYGLFGLDRVPVDRNLRNQEHRHTYDHRAAATSGPARYVCTICGKVRLRSG
ncbi:MAG: hypothetical protein QNJ71_06650 [Acidimicrobiia bacterium]|nr:hypothetical protein [Acidimicrobiia bacterium]